MMPPNANTSGYCCMRFDVDKNGRTKKIRAERCTSDIFLEPSRKTISKWKYAPAQNSNGKPVRRRGVENFMAFFLTDENGDIIRNSEGFPQHIDPDGNIIIEKQKVQNKYLCNFLTS